MANCPASRPSLTTGQPAPKVSTTAICSSTLNMSRMLLGWNSAKLSAQSPPCSRKALPAATAARRSFEPPRLAGKDQRRKAMQCLLDAGECGFVGITRHLPDRQAAPAVGRPSHYLAFVRMVTHHLRGWRPLHHRRHSDQREPETRKPPRSGGFGKTRKRDPRPPSCTGGTKIARVWQGPHRALTVAMTAR